MLRQRAHEVGCDLPVEAGDQCAALDKEDLASFHLADLKRHGKVEAPAEENLEKNILARSVGLQAVLQPHQDC